MNLLDQWGPSGVCLAAIAVYYAIIQKSNREERERIEKANREEREELIRIITKINSDSNAAILGLTGALIKLSTLIDTIKDKI